MNNDIVDKAKLLLKGEKPELVEKYYKILKVWPDKKQVQSVIQELGYKIVRYSGPRQIIQMDFTPNRITIFYNDNNKITEITEN